MIIIHPVSCVLPAPTFQSDEHLCVCGTGAVLKYLTKGKVLCHAEFNMPSLNPNSLCVCVCGTGAVLKYLTKDKVLCHAEFNMPSPTGKGSAPGLKPRDFIWEQTPVLNFLTSYFCGIGAVLKYLTKGKLPY